MAILGAIQSIATVAVLLFDIFKESVKIFIKTISRLAQDNEK